MKAFYDFIAEELPHPSFRFLNYGYAEPTSDGYRWMRAADRPYKYHLSLVRHVVRGIRFKGKNVLEIGAGRGGNCDYLLRYTPARRVVGLDLSEANVHLCRRLRRGSRIWFLCGDAERLPLRDETFDVVLNLESSHCYVEMGAFLEEVYRVLRPGGTFAYADFWNLNALPHDWEARARALSESRFRLVFERDITEPVFQALKGSEGLSALLDSLKDPKNRETVEWLVQANEAMRFSLASRQCNYKIWRFRKPHRKEGNRNAATKTFQAAGRL